MDFRLSDIKNFLAAASCRTLSEAAIKLEISQPALTESIKRLESDSNHLLFYRSRSGVQLTPFGRDFLEKCKRLMGAYEDLAVEVDSTRIFGSRIISIGCHPVVAQYSLPKALKHLASLAPDYQIQLKHNLSRTIQFGVQKGEIDIGIVINPVMVPDLVIQRLGFDEVSVWQSKSQFDQQTLLCNLDLFQTQSIVKKWKKHPVRMISTESLELIARLTSEGIGFGILPARAIDEKDLKLKRRSDLPSFRDVIALCYRPEFGKSLSESSIIESIKKVFKDEV